MSYKSKSAGSILAALLTVAAPKLLAQAAPAAAPNAAASDETIVLSPFVVDASEDAQSYQANSTLAGTRVRTDLRDVASSITVVTQQFLQDTNSHNVQDLLVYTPNTEVAGLRGNFSGQAGNPQYNENTTTPNNTTRVRGLDSADNTRDYFITDIPFDDFNTGRIDLQRGPNSILFGVGSPAGIINASIDDPIFKNTYKLETEVGSYGTFRNSGVFNRELIKNVLAIRIAALSDDEKYQEDPAFNNTTREYAAVRFDPKLFGDESHTSIRAKFEKGKVNSQNPRTLPPVDEITPWFTTLGKASINTYIPGDGSNSNNSNLFDANNAGWKQGRSYWADVLSYYNGANSQGVLPTTLSNTPTDVHQSQISAGYGINSSGGIDKGIGGLPTYAPLAIPDYALYATHAANIQGGAFYSDKVLTDPSIFDFYNKLLDGNNSKQWQKWTALNVAVDQTFFDDRLAFEATVDHQDYTQGAINFLDGVNYAIGVDVNQVFSDGTPNPNVGRPYVTNSTNNATQTNIVRNSYRFTGTAELRAEDLLGKTKLADILGKQVITGLISRDERKSKQVNWELYATTPDYAVFDNANVNPLNNERQFDWIDYLGPSLSGASSAAGANVSNIQTIIKPSTTTQVRAFNSHWAAGTSVNPAAPYFFQSPSDGSNQYSTQSENPANYVGWQNETVTWLSASDPTQFPDLVSGGSQTNFRDVSKGLTWQGHLLGGDLVPVYGWRQDSIVNYNTVAPFNSTSGLYSLDYTQDPTSRRTISGQSRSWGGVYHLPKALMDKIPGGTTLSFFYDRSNNFKGDAPRQNLAGNTIANPTGQTREYGFTITTLDDKLSLKVNRYNTKVVGATFDPTNGNSIAGLGGNGYWMWAAPTWGYFWAAQLQDGLEGKTPGNNYYNYALGKSTNGVGNSAASGGVGTPGFDNDPETAISKTIVDAWLNDFPLNNNFFNYYGIHPITINPALAKASGQLASAFGPGYNDTNSDPGTGSQQPGGIAAVSTEDNISKGTEFELTAQPIKNWNLSVNYSRTNATKTNIDPTTTAFMNDLYKFFTGPGGQLREWGNSGNPIGADWITNVFDPYEVEVFSAGQSAPEVAKWRLNGVTTFTFDHGAAKGFFIGGGVRVEAPRILGYHFNPNLGVGGALDPSQPWMGKTDSHFDLWFGYSRKIYKNVNWRIQANLRDIGDKTHLVASQVEPDGSWALERIQEGTSWSLTNTFEF